MNYVELKKKYFHLHCQERSKGKNRAPKLVITPVLRDGMRWEDYMRELKEVDPHMYGLELCYLERYEFQTENHLYWGVAEHRKRIAALKKKYGLSNREVQKFLTV
jgi:hypothetical protein